MHDMLVQLEAQFCSAAPAVPYAFLVQRLKSLSFYETILEARKKLYEKIMNISIARNGPKNFAWPGKPLM